MSAREEAIHNGLVRPPLRPDLKAALQLIEKLAQQGFYGSVELNYSKGEIVLIRKEETFKPTLHNPSTGSNHDEQYRE
jgi:hypothetical protein